MRRSRLANVAVALLLVLSAVGGALGPASVTQTASAEFVGCNNPVAAVPIAAYNTIMGAEDGCRWESGAQEDYENQTATDLYQQGLGLSDTGESYRATTQNWLETSRGVGYYKGKAAAVRGLENGTTESQTVSEAEQAVDDFYSRIQYRMVQNYNARMKQIEYMEAADDDGGGFGPASGTVLGYDNDLTDTYANDGYGYQWTTVNVTLLNGTQVEVNTWESVSTMNTNINLTRTPMTDYSISEFQGEDYEYKIAVKDPDTGNPVVVFNAKKWGALNDKIEAQHSAVRAEMNNYVSGVYQNYSQGDINATQLYQNDPTLLAQEAATDYNTTGYYGYSSVQLASIGLAGDTNASHVVTVDGGNNWTGTLYYTGADGTTFTTGETYDFGNLSGSVYMAASSGPNNQTGIVNLTAKGSSFTIQEATNVQTGEAINTTTVNKYVYDDANATALQSEIDRLEELREFYEEQASASGGVGINLGTDDKAIIGVIAAVVLVLALRD